MLYFIRKDCFELFTGKQPPQWPKSGAVKNDCWLFAKGFCKLEGTEYFETFGMQEDFKVLCQMIEGSGYTREQMKEMMFPFYVYKYKNHPEFLKLKEITREILQSGMFEGILRDWGWKFICWPDGLQLISVSKDRTEGYLRVSSKSSSHLYVESPDSSMKQEGKLGFSDSSEIREEDHWVDLTKDSSWKFARTICNEYDSFVERMRKESKKESKKD